MNPAQLQLPLPGLDHVVLALVVQEAPTAEALEAVCAQCACTASPRRGVCRCHCHPAARRAG